MWCQLLGSSLLCRNPRLFLSFTSSIAYCLSLLVCMAGFSAPYTFHYRLSGSHRSHSEYLEEAAGGSSFPLLTRYPVFHLEFVLLSLRNCLFKCLIIMRYMRNWIFFSHTCQCDTSVSHYDHMWLCHCFHNRNGFWLWLFSVHFLKCSEKLLLLPCGCQTRFTKHSDSFYQMILHNKGRS